MKAKFLLYFDDIYGLGHVPFFNFIIKSLVEFQQEVTIILGSKAPSGLMKEGEGVRCIALEDSKNILLRTQQLQTILDTYHFDIFLMDHFPIGKFATIDELTTIFDYFDQEYGKYTITFTRDIYMGERHMSRLEYTQLFHYVDGCTMGGIIHPSIQHLKSFNANIKDIFLKKLFIPNYFLDECISEGIDGILVFGDKKIHDMSTEFILSQEQKKVFYHIGYTPQDVIYNKQKVRDGNIQKVLVSTGGNLANVGNFIKVLGYLTKIKNIHLRVLIGPHTNMGVKKLIIQKFSTYKNIEISGFSHDFHSLLSNSDIFIGFGGYGTFLHLFSYTGKALILANGDYKNFRHRYYEQKHRAQLLEPYLNIKYIEDISLELLQEYIDDDISHKRDTSEIDFCTSQKLMSTIADICGKKNNEVF